MNYRAAYFRPAPPGKYTVLQGPFPGLVLGRLPASCDQSCSLAAFQRLQTPLELCSDIVIYIFTAAQNTARHM
jgi:hypothetical protein